MVRLDAPIQELSHVGPRAAARLKKLGIERVSDLLRHFPSRYEDYSQVVPIAAATEAGAVVSIRGVVSEIKSVQSWKKRRLVITNAVIEDESGSIRVVWFNQPYIERTLPEGSVVNCSGKVALDKRGLYLASPSYERSQTDIEQLRHTGRLVPRYPETEGITSKYLRFLIKPLLDQLRSIPDPLPHETLERHDLSIYTDALHGIHFPEAEAEVELAKRRFAFEELLLFQLRALQDRRHMQTLKAPVIAFDKKAIATFVKQLPFALTDDQRVAAYEILQDLERSYPMNRLLNGDVGSGKTIVSLIAAFQAVQAGYQVIVMAPTEILAKQHFQTAQRLFASYSQISIGLLTGNEARQWPTDAVTEEKISKKLMHEKIKKGQIKVIVGTHALIQKDFSAKKLGLVIIDEQHRFGVEQRMKLAKSSDNKNAEVPHLLSMTATPIPRTLALTIYGDLDVSLIKQKPKGRQKIVTKVVSQLQREQAYRFIDQHIVSGRQVFVICPRIDISKPEDLPVGRQGGDSKAVSLTKLMWEEVKAVTEEYKRLQEEVFPHRRVIMLHGKMKAVEKDEIMRDFKDGKYDILISTSVIEVGVDVPNASIMMIESAERFGLSQLHQFRGRVGRGSHQSHCFLLTSSGGANQRLKALEKTDNGFELAEVDMKLRGPGEFTGVKQSGMPDLAMASLSDVELIKEARAEAKLLLQEDPELSRYPLLRERLSRMQRMVHFE